MPERELDDVMEMDDEEFPPEDMEEPEEDDEPNPARRIRFDAGPFRAAAVNMVDAEWGGVMPPFAAAAAPAPEPPHAEDAGWVYEYNADENHLYRKRKGVEDAVWERIEYDRRIRAHIKAVQQGQLLAQQRIWEERARKEHERVAKMQKLKEQSGMFKATVNDYFGTQNYEGGMFGIEVEVEGANLPAEIAGFKAHRDGSLRGEALEYVFRQPYSYEDTLKKLKVFEKSFKNARVDMSYRTSVHVHVNVNALNKAQLCTFLYLSYLFETALVNYCGPTRIGNRFCLRIIDAVDKVRELEAAFVTRGFQVHNEDAGKYSAINLACTPKYGSVEFRSMRGTVSAEEIGNWVSLLNQLYNAALKYKHPRDVAQDFLDLGAKGFAEKVFEDFYKVVSYEDLEHDLRTNFSLLISLPYEEIKDFV